MYQEPSEQHVIDCFSKLTLVTDDPDLISLFKCSLCHSVIYNPRECSDCSTLFCRACIYESDAVYFVGKEKRIKCPSCSRKRVGMLQLKNRHLKNLYHSLKVKGCSQAGCHKAHTQMRLEEFALHIETECMKVKI